MSSLTIRSALQDAATLDYELKVNTAEALPMARRYGFAPDPKGFRDLATFEQPLQRSVGIERVYLNGQLALTARDASCRQRAGRVLVRAVP